MTRRDEIKVGQRYRTVGTTAFGAVLPIVWEVAAVIEGPDGHAYARLIMDNDHTRTKSVVATMLADRRHYQPIER